MLNGHEIVTIPCPVCGSAARHAFDHPDAAIWRCPECTHAFTRLDTLARFESYDDDYYREFHKNWFDNPNLRLFEWISSQLGTDWSSLLDVGCGKGDLLRYLRNTHRNKELVGVDLSDNVREEGIRYIQADILDVDLGERFDVVVNLAVIEHVPDVRAFVQGLTRLCKPGGRIVVMTLNEASLLYRIARLGRRLGFGVAFKRLYSIHHLHHFTPASLSRLLSQAGLTNEIMLNHNPPMNAIDIPSNGAVAKVAYKSALSLIFALGKVLGSAYLQTMVVQVPSLGPQ